MSRDGAEDGLADATEELLAALRDLEDAVEPPRPDRLVRPPTPRGILAVTSEVAIPGAIFALSTNIAALELLQRTLRMANGHDPERVAPIRDRTVAVTEASLSRLDAALADLQGAVSGRPGGQVPEELLEELGRHADDLEAEIDRLDADTPTADGEETPVDVEAELDSLRESVDDAADAGDP